MHEIVVAGGAEAQVGVSQEGVQVGVRHGLRRHACGYVQQPAAPLHEPVVAAPPGDAVGCGDD